MLSNFHKTTSECWWKTPGTQKGSLFSSKVGRTKYKKQKERQRVRDGDPSRGGSHEGEVSKHQETPLVGSFGISEGNITGREKKKKKKPTEYVP